MSEPGFDATLRAAERVASILAGRGIDSVVIGAMALAFHDYPRATEDVDLAVAVPPSRLAGLAEALRAEGWTVDVRMPDAVDPLGGVIDVRAPGADPVQVVNFDNGPAAGFPRLVSEAVRRSIPLGGSAALRVADASLLVAFKLYAGGPKSALDILELLERASIDMAELRRTCAGLGLEGALDRVLALRGA